MAKSNKSSQRSLGGSRNSSKGSSSNSKPRAIESSKLSHATKSAVYEESNEDDEDGSSDGSGDDLLEEEYEEDEEQGDGIAAYEADPLEGLEDDEEDEFEVDRRRGAAKDDASDGYGDSSVDSESGGNEDDEQEDDGSDDEERQRELARLEKSENQPAILANNTSLETYFISCSAEISKLPLSALSKAQSTLSGNKGEGAATSTSSSRLAEIRLQLAEIQKRKGKAKTVDVGSLVAAARNHQDEESGQSDLDDDEERPMGLREVRRVRKEDRAREREEEAAKHEERERLKRKDKHAPVAMSAKRPVSRMRQVVELPKNDRRDPRFDNVSAANTDVNLTKQSYNFVPQLMREEFDNLRKALQGAQKLERNSPREERAERVAERERLEREVDRARSRVERYEREARDQEVLRKIKKEEREKRTQGQSGYFVKRSAKKDALLEARYQALEAEGGKRAVKKAIEKKQKKVAGREKKSRPFARNGGDGARDGSQPFKRRRV